MTAQCTIHNTGMYESKFKPGSFYHYIGGEKANGSCTGEGVGAAIRNGRAQDEEPIREPLKERDFDAEARGKVRHGIAVAFIERGEELDDSTKSLINHWVEYVMTGK